MSTPFSIRDEELLVALARRVRLFTLRQVANQWWGGEVANARRRMRQLAENDWIERITVSARTLPELARPVIAWRPGAENPNFEATAYQLQRRWQSLPLRSVSALIATARAAHTFGGRSRGELKHPLQATHDLGVAQVWLTLRATAPQWAAAWCGEDLLAHTRKGEKCPDAFVVTGESQIVCVIEFGGQYRTERVLDFHYDCQTRGLPYQIW